MGASSCQGPRAPMRESTETRSRRGKGPKMAAPGARGATRELTQTRCNSGQGPRPPAAGDSSARYQVLLVLLAPVLLSALPLAQPQSQLCFDMISNLGAIYLEEHPVGGRAAVAFQSGKIFLMTIPPLGGTKPMATISIYLDLSSRVTTADDELGLLSFAFHPGFARNGRFFVSYICDSRKHPDCKANFGCISSSGCLRNKGPGSWPTTVIAEYSAGPNPLKATQLKPKEVRRILTYSRPHTNHMGGHIFFGKDSLLYITSGDGGSQGDPDNLAQNIQSYYGKVMRMNVNARTKLTNYTIPPQNPFRAPGQNPLVYALGLRNPWRCDQDPVTGVIACGDVGADKVEEVDVIVPRGNYAWRNYEGPIYRTGERNLSKLLGNAKKPVFAYTHASLGNLGCIIGGVFYRSRINSCLLGKYLYADHSGPIWVASIGPKPTTQRVTFKCSSPSPFRCPAGGDGSDTEWGEINSWSKDRSGNAYLLTISGIFRLAKLSSCGIKC